MVADDGSAGHDAALHAASADAPGAYVPGDAPGDSPHVPCALDVPVAMYGPYGPATATIPPPKIA